MSPAEPTSTPAVSPPFHRLLERQLRRHLPSGAQAQGPLRALLQAVDSYYKEVDQERALLENAMAVSAQELGSVLARLEREQALLRGVMDAIPDPIFYKNTQGRYLGCNRAFARYLGRPDTELVGKTDAELMPARIASDFQHCDEDVLRTGKPSRTERWLRDLESREDVCLDILRNPFRDLDGQLLGLIGSGRDITERKLAEETIHHQANYDPLTELPNRRHFYERLAHEIKSARRAGTGLALMMIDLDKFKEVNDILGHAAGDSLLAGAAQRIRSCVRDTDMVARLGGDEFTVVVPDLQDPRHAERIAQSIVSQMSMPFTIGTESVCVSASVGITLFPDSADDLDSLIKNADQAMYFAKNSGRSRYSHFTTALQQAATRRRRLARDLREAVESRRLAVHYQPMVDLRSGGIHKAEALVRWNHPEEGPVSPAEFIPIAEDTGLIIDIGDFVFADAARLAKEMRDAGIADFQVSINMSPAQFRSPRNLVGNWIDQIAGMELPGEAIVIEITEGLLMRVDEFAKHKLEAMRAAGMQLSLDDFGTGYSAMAYLKRLQFDYLKIDQSFVRDLATVPSDRALCEAMIVMAHKLGLQVVAEGVESQESAQILGLADCDFGQGYLFAKAMAKDDFLAFVHRSQPASPPAARLSTSPPAPRAQPRLSCAAAARGSSRC